MGRKAATAEDLNAFRIAATAAYAHHGEAGLQRALAWLAEGRRPEAKDIAAEVREVVGPTKARCARCSWCRGAT